jgi:hypothetical protein
VDAVGIGDVLAQERPRAVALTLVLEFQVSWYIAMKAFEETSLFGVSPMPLAGAPLPSCLPPHDGSAISDTP